MSRKLHRGRRSVFRKKRTWIKPLVWVIVLILLAVGGYFLAPYVFGGKTPDSSAVPPESSITESSQEVSTVPPETVPPETEEAPIDNSAPVRAVYVPLSVLREKTGNGLDTWLQTLAADGFNSVVVQLKDYAGNVYYQSSTAGAATAKAVTETAMPLADLSALREQMAEKGGEQ